MTLHNWLHFFHVLSAIVWVGGGFVLSIFGSRARASSDPKAIPDFAQTVAYMGTRVMLPAVLGTLVFGLWMVFENAEWNFGQLWVRLAIGLFLLAFLIGAIYLGRIGVQLQRVASTDSANGKVLLGRWITGYWIVLLVLLVVIWDMVFKPGLGG
jgi:uncharacterized membrane protein